VPEAWLELEALEELEVESDDELLLSDEVSELLSDSELLRDKRSSWLDVSVHNKRWRCWWQYLVWR
jgi:hypothetical protein